MQKTLSYAALAAALAVASPVLAQSPSSGASREAAPQSASPSSTASPSSSTLSPSASGSPSQAPGTTGSSASSSGRDAAANVGASPEVASGMSVKDNTGAVIGQVTAIKGDMATIKMGADTFTVDTSRLGVQGGAATINASQAELKKMLPKK